MSSRPITNLERILASVNFKEDEVVLTPEPLKANGQKPVFDFNQIPAPSSEESGSEEESRREEDEFFTASQGSSYSGSDDVPLTPELLTPGVQVQTSSGSRNIWAGQHQSRTKKLVTRFQRSSISGLPLRKNKLQATSPAKSAVCNDSTSDGLDVYQERERNKKRKTKKRSTNGNDGKRGNEKEKRN